jgi:hypothetical protein
LFTFTKTFGGIGGAITTIKTKPPYNVKHMLKHWLCQV